jgi:hypothetical protein
MALDSTGASPLSAERTWPAPARPWSVRMVWHDLLFAHWPVEPAALRPLLPPGLELDTFDGAAWLGIVPFRMSGIRHYFLPPLPGVSAFPELNVRTYVVASGKPGVWFLSLDAASRIAVTAARRFYHLAYRAAQMSCQAEPGGWIAYRSRRLERAHPPAEFTARYRGLRGGAAVDDPLASWLTARYCLYSADPRGGVWRGEIQHVPWTLEAAEAEFETNTMTVGLGVALPNVEPLLHFSRRLEAVAWPLERVTP